MEIENIAVEKLIPYEFNNKVHDETQVNRIANSIKEFGFLQPIVIDKDNVIIVGHGRLEGAKKLGLKEVPCVRAENLTETQIKKYRILDNKLNESAYNIDNLKLELNDLGDLNIGDIELNIDDVFPDLDLGDDEEETEIEEDEAPEVQTAKIVRGGDLFTLGNHRLLCGDATSQDDIDTLTDGEIIDLVFTDPPYGISIVGDNGKVGAENLAKNRVYSKVIADDTTDTAEKSYNLLKQVANKLIIRGGNYFTKFLDESDGWIIRDKRGDIPSNNFADGEMAYCSFHTPVRIYKQIRNGMIREGEHEERVHPTQKPVKMLGKIMSDFSNKDNTILDVFGGSGSTLIACEQLQRKCYMMELDPKYIEVIIKRFHNLNPTAEIKCLNREINIKDIL